ncbi:hypothetical protein M2323_001138 [Rhodoblastus acidophilus]|uniref:hypothetical protein n=1 Tax=Rhodoblastus acidophilus TaxID=1074 RepID=UPI0022243467|nr:hypothetical protein [Rhodoblastus acidophilus]MCW2283448.1 hypothetical protein [Rhodoblastus acidophilus]MCW2332228.1 hypothetical protein [Rhodoblastus acidophilus]
MTERRPLTHHEILRLIEPFTRRGRHVDLAASDRGERRLVFKPVAHDSEADACAGASEALMLEDLRPNVWRLTRTMILKTGEAARLATEGSDLAELLDRIEAVAPEKHFKDVGGVRLARSYRLDPTARTPSAPVVMALTAAEARLDGVTLKMKSSAAEGYPAEIELLPQGAQPHDLPDDLLAALGWDWKVLRRRGAGWIGALRAPGREPERSKRVEMALEAGVAHLTRTLAEPPRLFHERFVWARWLVVIRRMTPALLLAALLAAGVALAFADIPTDTPLARFLLAMPGFMFYGIFALRELPRLEVPPPPRPSSAPSWFPTRASLEAPEVAGAQNA